MINRITSRARRAAPERALLWLVVVLPLALGWLVGTLAYGLAVVWAAAAEGYRTGRRLPHEG